MIRDWHRGMNKSRWARNARLWHRRLGWVGGVAMLLFGLSGLTHPLMTWFGPQPAVFFPPQAHVEAAEIAALPATLIRHGIISAQQVRIVPTSRGKALQVSDSDRRRYFDLDSGLELSDFDRQQAEWLARYYTGLSDALIEDLYLQTHFDNAYPEVNRLLPVWRVSFASDDGLTAFVHTELGALAALSNDVRTVQQTLFRGLHSFSWLGDWELLRVALLTTLCLALLGLGLAGAALVFVLPARHIPSASRRWHRHLALLLWIPLLAFSASGLYHLWHKVTVGGDPAFVAAPTLDLRALWQQEDQVAAALHSLPLDNALNSASLLAGPEGAVLLRLAQPKGRHGEHVHRQARFDGTATERQSHLVALTGAHDREWSDDLLASHFAREHLGILPETILAVELVTAFGPDYDFRNKRLPVWRVRHLGGSAFIDPVTGILVDHATTPDRWEGRSFGHLHKWNFLTPWVGRQVRDSLTVVVILLTMVSALLGMGLKSRRRRLVAPGKHA